MHEKLLCVKVYETLQYEQIFREKIFPMADYQKAVNLFMAWRYTEGYGQHVTITILEYVVDEYLETEIAIRDKVDPQIGLSKRDIKILTEALLFQIQQLV